MTFEPRRTEPGTKFTYTEPDGSQRNLEADDEGVVRPTSEADVAHLDALELPVARKAIAEEKKRAAAEPTTSAKED